MSAGSPGGMGHPPSVTPSQKNTEQVPPQKHQEGKDKATKPMRLNTKHSGWKMREFGSRELKKESQSNVKMKRKVEIKHCCDLPVLPWIKKGLKETHQCPALCCADLPLLRPPASDGTNSPKEICHHGVEIMCHLETLELNWLCNSTASTEGRLIKSQWVESQDLPQCWEHSLILAVLHSSKTKA